MNRQTEARMVTAPIRTGAKMQTDGVTVVAGMVPTGIHAHAAETDRPDLDKPIRVKPEESQMLQWLTPGNVIEYTILTNFDWKIE